MIDRGVAALVEEALRSVLFVEVVMTSPLCVPQLMRKKGYCARPTPWLTRVMLKTTVGAVIFLRKRLDCLLGRVRPLAIERYDVTWFDIAERAGSAGQ